jgi:redox-sensitive bicupin YhaK (pirin superfamily)
VASRDGRVGSLTIHQDAKIFAGLLRGGDRVTYEIAPDRKLWVHVARGDVELNGQPLGEGDGAAIQGERSLDLRGRKNREQGVDGEILVFDLA